jgi:hypothetical protein
VSPRTTRLAALTAFAFTVLVMAAAVVLEWLTRNDHSPNSISSGGASFIVTILTGLTLLLFPVAGVVIALRRPGTPIGWLLLAIGLGWGTLAVSVAYADYGLLLHPGSVPAADVSAGISLGAWAPPIGITGTFLLLLFPDGRLPGRRWRPVAWLAAFAIVALTIVATLAPGTMAAVGYAHTRNPLGLDGAAGVVSAAQAIVILLPIVMVASAISLIVRFRRSGRVERQQIKWLAAAAALAAGVYLTDILISALINTSTKTEPFYLQVLDNLSIECIGLVPIAICIAVLRHRLYEIDVIIRRTLSYAGLVAALAAIYLLVIAAVGTLVRHATGSSGTVAVTVSTLAVAAAFQPLRLRIQSAVDRRFSRSAYDAQAAVDAFSGHLREQIDLEALSAELLAVVGRTVQPAHSSLWIGSLRR